MTRVVELTVHTCDLCAAIGLDEQPPEAAAEVTFWVLGGLAATHPRRGEILRALTGRLISRVGPRCSVEPAVRKGAIPARVTSVGSCMWMSGRCRRSAFWPG